jgi:hypothetical protein
MKLYDFTRAPNPRREHQGSSDRRSAIKLCTRVQADDATYTNRAAQHSIHFGLLYRHPLSGRDYP